MKPFGLQKYSHDNKLESAPCHGVFSIISYHFLIILWNAAIFSALRLIDVEGCSAIQ
jgi:hypothetical protein